MNRRAFVITLVPGTASPAAAQPARGVPRRGRLSGGTVKDALLPPTLLARADEVIE